MPASDSAREKHERRIVWRVNLRSPPSHVYDLLATAAGRERFWARAASQLGDDILFVFHGGEQLRARIVDRVPGRRFALRYFGNSLVEFELADDGGGGTDVTLTESGCPAEEFEENLAGWVSVLLQLKAAADHGVDLRNQSPERNWTRRYVDI